MGYMVKFWDGSKSEVFTTKAEALKAGRVGLKDWMNDDDGILSDYLNANLWVVGGSEGPTDACCKICEVK